MNTKGVRILDKENGVVSVQLHDILREVSNGHLFTWSILCFDSMVDLGKDKSILEFEKVINDSKKDSFITWEELNILSKKFHQIIDMVLLGCKDKNSLRRYEHDRDMCETCDIVIDMIDTSYWEVFSKDDHLINRLASKFKDIQFLTSDLRKDLI